MQSPRLTLRGGLPSPSPFRCAAPSKHMEERRESRLEGKASKRASKGDMRAMGRRDEEVDRDKARGGLLFKFEILFHCLGM